MPTLCVFILSFLYILRQLYTLGCLGSVTYNLALVGMTLGHWAWPHADLLTSQNECGVLGECKLWEAMGIKSLWSALSLSHHRQAKHFPRARVTQTDCIQSIYARASNHALSSQRKCMSAHLSSLALHLAWVVYILVLTKIKIPLRSLGDLPG